LERSHPIPNVVESMIEICRDRATNVKRWESGTIALRWCTAELAETAKQFRRVDDHKHLRATRAALEADTAVRVTPPSYPAGQELAA